MSCFEPIGYVRHYYTDEGVKAKRAVDAVIEVLPQYEEGLRGIEEFSHVIVVAFLHKFRGRPLVVRPRRVANAPEIGVFATDSPDRPNPIGITVEKLVKREGGALHVEGVDLFNSTPILNIKGFTPKRCPGGAAAPWRAD